MGIRRPRQRRLPHQIRLDPYRPTPDGDRCGVPTLTEYWATRRRKRTPPPVNGPTLGLLKTQNGTCPICGQLLLHADDSPRTPDQWEQWLRAIRTAITRKAITPSGTGKPGGTVIRLLHTNCWRQHLANSQPDPAPAHDATGLTRKPPGAAARG
jgi:hypothetical protein